MSKTLKTTGIIIKNIDYSDYDKIFEILDENGDLISFFCRNAKKSKSKFSGVISLGNFIDITYRDSNNLKYPIEINHNLDNIYHFHSKSIEAMNFFGDILNITKTISHDYKNQKIYSNLLNTFYLAESGEYELIKLYINYLKSILTLIDINIDLICNSTSELINENKFYYHANSNLVFSLESKPQLHDLNLIKSDAIFEKNYYQKKLIQNLNMNIRLKF